jgi:phosphinothricin acetyltransferase
MAVDKRAPQQGLGSLIVRRGRLADLPRLHEIYNHYMSTSPVTFDLKPSSLEERRAWFARFASTGTHRLLVAEERGAVLGYAGSHQFRARKAYDTTVETTVYCAPEATGRGIGGALYKALFDALRGEDLRMAVAGITLPNDASVALHERFGFTRTGVFHEIGRKFDRYWDVAWYEKRLG